MAQKRPKFKRGHMSYASFYNWVWDHMDELSETEQKICLAVLMEVKTQNVYQRERFWQEKYCFRMTRDIVDAHGGRDAKPKIPEGSIPQV